jgi:hypothetical protein
MRPRAACLVISAVFALCAPARALIEQLSDRDVARAFAVANSDDTQRARFHHAYVVAVTDPAIELIDVITELRRFVLAAEEELKAGNWMLARGGYDAKGRSLRDLLRPKMGQVAIRARLRFHPQNVYVTLPPVDVLLGEPTLLAMETLRTPHVDAAPQRGDRDVISGATIEAAFNAPSIANRALPVRVVVDGKELVRVVVDFARVE